MNQKEEKIFNKGIAVGMKINNSTRKEIQEVTGLSRWTQKRVENSTQLGQKPLERKKGSGRPRSLNEVNGRKILNQINKNRSLSLRSIQKDQNLNKNGYCLTTLSNFVHENGYQSVRKRKQIILSEQQMKTRLHFCKKMLKKNDVYLQSICWSDECKITLDSIGVQFVLKKDQEDCLIIWARIDSEGIIRMKWLKPENGKKIDSKYYIEEVLKKYVIVFKQFKKSSKEKWIFQQNHAPIHNSKATSDFLQEHKINIIDWPARSPDLNPIENIWPWPKRRISSLKSKLKNANEIWSELDRLTDLPEFNEVYKTAQKITSVVENEATVEVEITFIKNFSNNLKEEFNRCSMKTQKIGLTSIIKHKYEQFSHVSHLKIKPSFYMLKFICSTLIISKVCIFRKYNRRYFFRDCTLMKNLFSSVNHEKIEVEEQGDKKYLTEEERWLIVIASKYFHLTQKEISERFNFQQSTISRYLQRYNETGSIEYKFSNCGRNMMIEEYPQLPELIRHEMVEDHQIKSRQISYNLENKNGIEVSHQTVCKILNNQGFNYDRIKICHKLTEYNKNQRIQYINEISKSKKLNKYIYSDESIFSIDKFNSFQWVNGQEITGIYEKKENQYKKDSLIYKFNLRKKKKNQNKQQSNYIPSPQEQIDANQVGDPLQQDYIQQNLQTFSDNLPQQSFDELISDKIFEIKKKIRQIKKVFPEMNFDTTKLQYQSNYQGMKFQ
ncbi:hypothetical protein ABPG72_014012 [Tetrahymena utriculariae]